jgi:hypothetical protein
VKDLPLHYNSLMVCSDETLLLKSLRRKKGMNSKLSSSYGRVAMIFTVLTLCILTACTPVPTPIAQPTSIPLPTETSQPSKCEPVKMTGNSSVTMTRLPDNSEIYLSENTQIELTTADNCPGVTETSIILLSGQVAIKANLPVGSWFIVTNPGGFIARINGTGAVEFDATTGQFLLDCTNGNCTLGPSLQQFAQFGCNEGGGLSNHSTFPVPLVIDVSALQSTYGDWIVPTCVAAKTPTLIGTPNPTGTPLMAKTATAACAAFHSKFPGTPCP